jgi:hypothetical protein
MADGISAFRRRDGSLASAYPLVSWLPGEARIVLDGEFTPAQLRAMAEFMDRRGKPSTRAVWPYVVPCGG